MLQSNAEHSILAQRCNRGAPVTHVMEEGWQRTTLLIIPGVVVIVAAKPLIMLLTAAVTYL